MDDAIDDVLAVTSFLEVLDPLAAARLAFYDGDAAESADVMWATLVAPSQSCGADAASGSSLAAIATTASSSTSVGDLTDSSSSESGRSISRKRVLPPPAVDAEKAGGREQRQPRGKTRKSTYTVRKEERNELLVEIAALEMRLKALNEVAGLSDETVADTELQNARLRESVHSQQLSLATAQSVVSGLLNREKANPLSTPIYLGTDWGERRRTLEAMKDEKIRHAYEYLDARSQFADPLKEHAADERFENARGDYCCVRYEANQFTGVRSVKEVYDALVGYLFNVQDAISQQLGNLTVRHDFDLVEGSIANYHFLTNEHGVPIETHGVLFMQYFDSHTVAQGGPCGIVVVDCVENDAMYPYAPSERLRKDVTSIKMLTPHYRPRADGSGEQELVVTLTQGKFLKLHHAECASATPEVVAKIRASIVADPMQLHWQVPTAALLSPGSSSDAATTMSDSSEGSPNTLPPSTHLATCGAQRKPRKRAVAKHTYYMRKEEKAALQRQIEVLQAQLVALGGGSALATPPDPSDILRQMLANENLRAAIRDQQRSIAVAQSAIAEQARAQNGFPFESFIHLTKNVEDRQTTLLALRDQKIQVALRYLTERTRFLGPFETHHEVSRYTTRSGDYCVTRLDVTPLEDSGKSVRQAYDALQFFFNNMEISVTEALGNVMIRESEESEIRRHKFVGASEHRFLSTTRSNVQVETNCAMFSAIQESGDGSDDFGVIVGDSVDVDDLFPYSPTDRVRQDVTAVLSVKSVPRVRVTESGIRVEERVVVLTRMCRLKLHATELHIPPHEMQELRDTFDWTFDLMLKNTQAFVSV